MEKYWELLDICFPVTIKGLILGAMLTGRTPTIDPHLDIQLNSDIQYNVICYFPFNTVALFKIGLSHVGTHECHLNEASQTATQTLSNQINMTTFRLKFAIRIIKKFMGESPNVFLVL